MRTYLYKAYSSSQELLYVGITHSVDQRLAAHRNQKTWWDDVASLSIETYSSREDAEAQERHQIATLAPKYNELPGVKLTANRRVVDRLQHTTKSRLPQEEIDYLKTLDSEQTYARCVELQQAGWSVSAMLEGARVAPTPSQLRTEIKYRSNQEPTGVPVPQPPKNKRQAHEEYRSKFEKANHLSEEEKELLVYYAAQAKKYRPQYGETHPIYQAAEEYKALITQLRDRGVLFSTMANVVGVDESNIRRRYIKNSA